MADTDSDDKSKGDWSSELGATVMPTTECLEPETWFEYTVTENVWPESAREDAANERTLGASYTVLASANREAEESFTKAKRHYTSALAVSVLESSSSPDDSGCMTFVAKLATLSWPEQTSFLKVWVSRREGMT